MKIVISESQYNNLILEYYDAERLYLRDDVVDRLKTAPRELRKYIKELPYIKCVNSDGIENICTKIPEVIYVYFSGNY